MICKNCSTEFEGFFCPSCGTKADIKTEHGDIHASKDLNNTVTETIPGVYDFSKQETDSSQNINQKPQVSEASTNKKNNNTDHPDNNINRHDPDTNNVSSPNTGIHNFNNTYTDQNNNMQAANDAVNKKKPIYKKPGFIITAVIIVLLIVLISGFSCSCNSHNSSKTSATAPEKAKSYDSWPNFGLAEILPKPDTDKIEIISNNSDFLSFNIYDTSEDYFDSYVSSCISKGFDKNFDSYSGSYTADNEEGYNLSLYYYKSDNNISVDLFAPIETETKTEKATVKATQKPTAKATEKPTVKETQKPTEAKKENNNEDTLTPSFKEMMDDYEQFMNDYVDFMIEYNNTDDVLGMLDNYTQWMSDYNEWLEKINEIDTGSLSPADYEYYLKVVERITKRLQSLYE